MREFLRAPIPLGGIIGQSRRKRPPEGRLVRGPTDLTEQRDDLLAGASGPPPREQLKRDGRQREDVGRGTPRLSRDPLRGAVRPSNGTAQPDALERGDNPKSGGARQLRCQKHVARMQGAVAHARGTGIVDGAGQLGDERKGRLEGSRRVLPHGDIQRFPGHVFLGEVGCHPCQTRGDRRDDRRVLEPHVNDAAELVDQGPGLLRCDAEAKHLDRDQTISTGFVSAKERSEDADPNLMQHPKWAERTSG